MGWGTRPSVGYPHDGFRGRQPGRSRGARRSLCGNDGAGQQAQSPATVGPEPSWQPRGCKVPAQGPGWTQDAGEQRGSGSAKRVAFHAGARGKAARLRFDAAVPPPPAAGADRGAVSGGGHILRGSHGRLRISRVPWCGSRRSAALWRWAAAAASSAAASRKTRAPAWGGGGRSGSAVQAIHRETVASARSARSHAAAGAPWGALTVRCRGAGRAARPAPAARGRRGRR